MNRRWLLWIALGALAFGGTAVAQNGAAKPLNIVVYGGSGNIGSRIVAEAAARGHHVTVVDKNPKPALAPKGVKVVTGDVFDQQDILKNIAGADVLVSAVVVRPAPTPDFALRVVQGEVAALRAQTGAKKTRLLVVGGASSLYTADGKRIIERFGGRQDGEVKSSVDSLDWLRAEVRDVPWTFFSPAMNIRPGTRTGKFRLGTEQVVTDEHGNSAISMEDYAVAMLDEIEKPQFINQRFTVGY
ncbi:MAG TPA: NAD(P)H-binding protein [Steroidobacteraceae bacterium]|nr:NAD(P)H-binding protein [Steroidobacteraceae bacterium]